MTEPREARKDEPDPVDELAAVIAETLAANALRITTSRGGYVGGGQPHSELGSDPGAIEAITRGLLARKVAEPSRQAETQRLREHYERTVGTNNA